VKVGLHTCCGPCLLEPLDVLAREHEVVVIFANPNIQPAEEHARRRDAMLHWARERGLSVHEVTTDQDAWEEAVAGFRDAPEKRCPRCYELRLRLAAAEASRLGCDALSTTLSVSPYQNLVAIDEAGVMAAAEHGLVWIFEDHRSRYSAAMGRSRDIGMYRQDYCGCLPSREEAEADRERRRAERAAKQRAR